MASFGRLFLILTAAYLHLPWCVCGEVKGKGSSPLRFTHHLYNTTINENSVPHTYLETAVKMGVQVTEPLWDIEYNIVSGDVDNFFQAEALRVGDFCFLRIKTRSSNAALLNREVRDMYTLTVEAIESTFDLQAKTKISVFVLDMNDLKPLFYPASYNVAIREDTHLKSSMVTVSATDADIGSNAEFYYSFTSRAHPFAVDPFTGMVSLVKRLNYTRAARYDLTVLAEDRTKKISGVQKFGNVAKVTVNVQKVSSASPFISYVTEPTISMDGKITVTIHVEPGVKPVESLRVVGGDPLKCFQIIPLGAQGNHFQIISTKRIIWSQNPSGLNLSLQATDRSWPSLLSPIKEVHIPPPSHYKPLSFLEDTYIVTLSEFSPPQTHVVKVMVTSVPENVTFSIKNNPDSNKFKINPKTGIIVTMGRLDYETKKRYEFEVVANHGKVETHIVVEVTDENDNSPQFGHASYQASVDENTPVGASVLKVKAIDKDEGKNGFVTYAIANPGLLPFTIDPFTGVISTSEHLDYELTKRRYHLRVWASDSGSPFSQVTECPVTITLNNINDNIPLFERVDCNTTVPLNLPVGHKVVELSAIDSDELQQLRYIIQSGNELQVFAIDSVLGTVSLKQPIPVGEGAFTLRVVANDGKHLSEESIIRITVTNRGDEPTVHCRETGVFKELTDKLIQSIKPILTSHEEDVFSDIHLTNRHSPKFNASLPTSVDVAEDHPLNSTIVQFGAADADTGFNAKLVYAISSGNEDGCFSIDTFTGDLYLVCPVDREAKEFYILNITAYDLGTPQTAAWKFIAVNIVDVNDNAPLFDQPRYVVHVPENVEQNSAIFTARAVDLDLDASGSVQYSLLTSSHMFRIDQATGEVTVEGNLDRETFPRYDLLIEARDQAKLGPQLSSTAELVVVLQDVNDNPPKFVPNVYKIRVPEDLPTGSLLVWIESVDLDLGSGSIVTYNLKNTEGGIFHLDSSTGALTLERELDFERRPFYNLTVRAVDHGLPRSLSSSCFVEIQVLDVNENLHKPVFSDFVHETGVMENAAVGTSVLRLLASDKDPGRDGVVRYHIHDGSGLGLFTIDEETGVIRTTEVLDREAAPLYWLLVYATDLGAEPLTSWTHVLVEVLDINDNPPELSKPVYFASVLENVEQVRSVVQVSASDADASSQGALSYHMAESLRNYFEVDPRTGFISTVAALDREDKPEHSLEVVVSDNGSPPLSSTATVLLTVLDANDNRPKFTDKLFHVRMLESRHHQQGGAPLEVCRMVARDDDHGSNAAVTYHLQGGDEELQHYSIDPQTGVVTARGHFLPGNYSILTVRATDQGSPPRSSTARLDVEWMSLPPPSAEPIAFDEPHFTFAVMETEPVTHMVGIIMTESGGGPHWFDIIGGDEEKDFDIQRNTGTISIARRLDAARRSNYNMTVRVTNGHNSATTQAYIRVLDMNEHRPVFLKPLYEVRVPEDTAPWKDILHIIAQDADANSKLVFSLHSCLHPDSSSFFHLDPKSGVLVLTEALDYESIATHTLIVMVRDQEIPVKRNFVKVVVQVEDCNDHSPSFLSPRYEVSVSNQAPAGSEVVRVKALDKDTGSNAEIRYALYTGNTHNIFSIDPEMGSITVSKPLDLQPQDQFHLTVKATDQGFPQRSDLCSVHVHVHISDLTPPAFPSDEYLTEISELSALATPVVTILATSPTTVHYGIESGNQNETFQINPYNGLISLQNYLDFEKCASYKLKVTASTATGVSSKTFVHIYVIDENDNAPVFQQREYFGQISESGGVDSMVMAERNTPLVIQASDSDRDSNSLLVYQILEAEARKVFKIDPSMGTISLVTPVDFEAKAEYHFSVQVKDSGEPALYAPEPTKVTVRILDLNDCPPKFTSQVYEQSIIFPAVRDSEVVLVTAHDADSAVSYSISDGNLHDAFSINPSTGVITVNNATGFRSFYQLGVEASDGIFKDTATVQINTTNLTVSDLKFEQKVYLASIAENQKSVQVLTALKTTGCFLNEPLSYTLLNPMGKFLLSPTSGILETTGVPFDREERDVYDLVVMVQDRRTLPRTATAQVKIFVDDVNDNSPQFLNLPFAMTIPESADPGDVLYQVTAIDRDLGENASIMYSLEEDYGLFRIDPDVGDISLQRPLDFEALNKYILTVVAVDEGEPNHIIASQLGIQVRNHSNPVFQTPLYPLKVPENIPPFTTILHVQARNPEGFRLIYNLQEENVSNYFQINFQTGKLTVSNPLDYESESMHVLTVRATDFVSGAFSEAIVEIEVEDVNDNAPVFSEQTYSQVITEGLPVGTSVIQLSASDRDSGRNKDLTFHIVNTDKNETDFFEIDRHSGLIVTKRVLDHEQTKQFTLKVRATDNGSVPLSTDTYVIINVTDINDNPPDFGTSQYEATLDEMAKCGHIVIKIQASDPDTGDFNNLKYKILSGNEGRYFNINESSGIISFSNVCRRNLDPYYNLTVAVSDGIFQKTARVNIDMMNSNRYSPYFKQSVYEAELAENAEVGTRVIRLAAVDPDDGPYGTVDYTIINKFADEKFTIDSNGQIVTTQPLDRENPAQRVIAIKVMAKDGGGKVAFCTVRIILTDENDNMPQFKASEYQVSIQSTVNKGSPVIQVIAYDADDGRNADVTYTVDEAEETTEDIIEINPFTGVVSVKESLVGMENKIFNFRVKARDGNLPFHNSTVPVQVKVVSPEVPLPKFTEPLYSFSAAEDVSVGTELGSVRADSDMPLIYSLVDGNTVESNKDKVFALDQDSGTLLVQKTIDHERTKWYQIDVVAQGNHNGTEVATLVTVNIQVQDVNDNEPMFDANPYRAFLAENMPAGTTVIQVTANDPDTDTNGMVTYSLEPLPSENQTAVTDMFAIDGESGWITTVREADCEVTRVYRFSVVATDHGSQIKLSSSVLVEVTVTDENDNQPHFLEDAYHGSVLESVTPGEVVLTMTTSDADVSLENRLVTCYITGGDPLGQFAVSQWGDGGWALIVKEPLDREATDSYTLTVLASDGKFEAQVAAEVTVLDINDNPPLCQQPSYTEAVMENSPSGVSLLKVSASDADVGANGQISYSLHGPHAQHFRMDPRTGELFSVAPLDREQESQHPLVVKATDGGGRSCQADVLLLVQDANDNPPHFSTGNLRVTIFDNTTVHTPVAVLRASDPDTGINSELRYSLQSGDLGYFSLDEVSGVLRLERPLTPEAPDLFRLTVRASDRGLPRHRHADAAVEVKVASLHDFLPTFVTLEHTVQVPESLQVGAEVMNMELLLHQHVTPLVQIHLVEADGPFDYHRASGSLRLAAPLDFEVSSLHRLSFSAAAPWEVPPEVLSLDVLVTDVNDNAPVFSRTDYSADIPEDLEVGAPVMEVVATDLDGPVNNLLRYSIVSGDTLQQFSIHPRSGAITVRTALDREQTPHYSLTVQAADEGNPPLSSAVLVTISVTDVNDNLPLFSQVNHSLVLQESEPVGSGILQLLVTDRDTPTNGPPFSFHIVSGNGGRRFQVDQGGLLSLAAPLSAKTAARHQLKIQVTDSGHPPLSSICVVNINVTEESKYPPSVVPVDVFITTTAGRTFTKRVIGKLHTTDQDPQDVLTFRSYWEGVEGGPGSRARFWVDQADGRIWVDGHLDQGSYAFNISVSDGRFTTRAGVKVHVWVAEQQHLDGGMTLRLQGPTAEEFLAEHWRSLQRSLAQGLSVPRQELLLASLQPLQDPQGLEVLLVWRPQDGDGVARSLPTARIAGLLSDLEDSLGLRVLSLSHDGCLGGGCPPRGCRNAVRLMGEQLSHIGTTRITYITPHHRWESVCSCNESALGFNGQSYMRFLHGMDEDEQDFKLSLRFRTSREDGVIVSTNTTQDWGVLLLANGKLHFTSSCRGSTPSLTLESESLSDGRWHAVLLEVNSTAVRLRLDQRHPALVTLPWPCRLIGSRAGDSSSFVFASAAPQLRASQGFTGCLEGLKLNDQDVRAGEESEWAGPGGRRVFGVYGCCGGGPSSGSGGSGRSGGVGDSNQVDPAAATCDPDYCQNGGQCQKDADGVLRCSCAGLFHGTRCELPHNPCASQPCAHGRVCVPKEQGYMCNCSSDDSDARCHNQLELCSANPCPGGFDCKVSGGSIHCDPLPQVSPMIGFVEMAEIAASVLGLLFLVAIFVCVRKRYVQQQQKKKKTAGCVQDSNGYIPAGLTNGLKADTHHHDDHVEMTSMLPPINDLDHTPFRSLRPRSQVGPSIGGGASSPRAQRVCSVAPNLPTRPPSCSDNDSIRKNRWDMDYEVYPADPDYYGRPAPHDFPQFDIVDDACSTSTVDSRRNSRFGGFPFPLERCDRRAPLPPCYSSQNLDHFLGADGLPLPRSQCPAEFTAISYYPAPGPTRSLDNVSAGGYKRLSVRLSVATPSYAERTGSPPPPPPLPPAPPPPPANCAQPQARPLVGTHHRSFDGSSIMESDYGSCEEVMF